MRSRQYMAAVARGRRVRARLSGVGRGRDVDPLGLVVTRLDTLVELHEAQFAFAQHFGDGVVGDSVGLALDLFSEGLQLVLQVPNTRFHRDDHLAESLVFESGSLQTSATVRQLVLEGVHHFAVLPAAHAAVLQLLAMCLDLLAQLIQRLDLALVLSCHRDEILRGAFLGHDLLNHFVHVRHACGLLDLAERVLENVHLVSALDLLQLDVLK
mmetsp:Transcript_28049/g.48007  ORF Transcript_28049/g.48007 Transcript_28049/m.48007 type:complete len:212 (+) Transcript_28049:467-1102(+)